MAQAAQVAEAFIKANRIAVFSKSYCPYCVRAKGIIAALNAPYKVMELDQMQDGAAVQAYLAQKTGQRTVPNIFICEQHVGGCSDLEELQASGELEKMVRSK